jgi:hypothetical protein
MLVQLILELRVHGHEILFGKGSNLRLINFGVVEWITHQPVKG